MFTEIVTEINRQRASRIVRGAGLFMFCRKAGLGIAMPIVPDYKIMNFQNNPYTQRHSTDKFEHRQKV